MSAQTRAHPVCDYVSQLLTILTYLLSRFTLRIGLGFSPNRPHTPQNRDHFPKFIGKCAAGLPPHTQIRITLMQRQVRTIPSDTNTSYPDDSWRRSDTLLPPLLVQTAPVESHYHRIHPSTSSPYRQVLLHSHSSAPYIHTSSPAKGLNLTLHTSGEPETCYPESITITVDWWTSIGRWGYRYWPVLATWSIGIVSLIIWQGLRVVVNENGEKSSAINSPA